MNTNGDVAFDNVVVLGAGASAAEGAPQQAKLLATYFQTAYTDPELRVSLAQMNEELRFFFDRLFRIDVSHVTPESNLPTFEELLGIVELAIQREELFRGFGDDGSRPQLRRLQRYLTQLISFSLDRSLGAGGGLHRRLLEALDESGGPEAVRKTCFVSLNYDIVIDNAIAAFQERRGLAGQVDYGIEFSNYIRPECVRADWRWPRPTADSISLLKFHGSLNWLYCSTCTAMTLTPSVKGATSAVLDPDRYRCPMCTERTAPVIVPPTFFKAMGNFHLQKVWRRTEAALMSAKRIIFCGYSLPDADLHVKYLLKRVEVNRDSTPEIVIINNYRTTDGREKSADSKATERSRYQRLFRDPAKVRYTELRFEDFAANGLGAL
jgi:hypothetical protein